MRQLAAFLLGLSLVSGAGAATVGGVDVPDSAQVANTNLVLNGAGLRKKFFIKVYVGALYVAQKNTDAAALLAAPGPDRVLMHMIYAVDKGQFADAWHEDFKNNNPQNYAALQADIAQFIGYFGDSRKDDIIIMDYVPGQGTLVTWNGTLRGTIAGEEFHKALLNVFLGPNPPTGDLKDGMLGKD